MSASGSSRFRSSRSDRAAALPSVALLVGTALLFTGLTATVMTIASGGDGSTPPPTRAPVTSQPMPAAQAARAAATTVPARGTAGTPPTTMAPVDSPPVAVAIPAIKVLAEIDPMGLTPDGKLQVPEDFGRVGWWAFGHKPGEAGPAVLEGHVDSTEGPAVFYALRKLEAGDEIQVVRRDRSTATFAVDHLASYPKDDFPSLDVYGPTDASTLRLITCTGSFSEARRSYRDNLVVYANLKQ